MHKQGVDNLGKNREATISDKGIALLMVLWVLTILMVLVLSFSFMTRTETYATLSFKERAENKFLAEAGIERAIMELFYRNVNKNQSIVLEGREVWKIDGTSYKSRMGEGEYSVSITDESGKIDINAITDATSDILRNLFKNLGVQEDETNTIVDSILDWKDADDLHHLSGAESDYYMSLPNPYKAKDANFDTVEELLLVKGMTPEILYGNGEKKGVIDFLTVSSNLKMTKINVNAAPKEVLMAIPGITSEIADGIISYREHNEIKNPGDVGIPGESMSYITFTDSYTFTIDAVGHKENTRAGFDIRATVIIVGNNNYRYIYYKSPANRKQ
jgi:general secretion pathway protein K